MVFQSAGKAGSHGILAGTAGRTERRPTRRRSAASFDPSLSKTSGLPEDGDPVQTELPGRESWCPDVIVQSKTCKRNGLGPTSAQHSTVLAVGHVHPVSEAVTMAGDPARSCWSKMRTKQYGEGDTLQSHVSSGSSRERRSYFTVVASLENKTHRLFREEVTRTLAFSSSPGDVRSTCSSQPSIRLAPASPFRKARIAA
eukprot:scaffold1401_cov330-Pavlova_lutheri.AAC.154